MIPIKYSKNIENYYANAQTTPKQSVAKEMTEEQRRSLSQYSLNTILEESKDAEFPIYIRKFSDGYFARCSEKDILRIEMKNYKELEEYASQYFAANESEDDEELEL